MAGPKIHDEIMRFDVQINGNEAQKELYDLEKANRSLTDSNKNLKAEQAKLVSQGKKNSVEYKNLSAEIKNNTAQIDSNKAKMKTLRSEIGLTGLTMRQLGQESSRLKLQIHNMTPGSAEYLKLQADLKAVDARMKELRFSSRATESSLSRMANGFNKYAAMGASFIAMGTGVVLSLQQMIDYNGKLADAQSDVQKTTGLTKNEVDELSKSFGAMKTRTARIELLQLAEEAGRLGIEGVENVKAFTVEANKLKVALGDDLSEEAIREVGKMVNVYEVGIATGKDFAASMDALGSSINEVSASGANQAGFLVDYLKRQAGIAAQAKLSAADNIGYAATFDEIGQSVEISATAMNKIWMDMFTNTSTYAKIAGMGIKDFNNLLQTDSNEAMIRFLEGLNGNNEGLSVMMEKLEDLEAGGARGVAALSSLANNTDLLRQRQETSNTALTEATSLTDEYNLKNANLAATIDKVKKKLVGAFASPTVVGGLTALFTGFGKLIGAIEDVNEAFAEESTRSFEAAKANRQLANESSKLLNEYESLTQDGIIPTAAEKERLEIITLQLKDRLGESVLMVDAETGAFKLNTEAVREQIKVKRLSADEEAATMASRLKGAQEEIKILEEKQKPIEREYKLRKKNFEEQHAADIEAINNISGMTAMEKYAMIERLDGYKEMDKALSKYKNINSDIAEQEQRRLDLLEKLKALNYEEKDIDMLFDTTAPEPEGIKEGATKLVGDNLYRYQNGEWVLIKTPKGDDPDAVKFDAAKAAEELRKMQFENDKLNASLIADSFQKELDLENANHQERLAQLRSQLIDTTNLRGEELRLAQEMNKEVHESILIEEEIHQNKIGTIVQKGLTDKFQKEQTQHEREKQQRLIDHNEELAALGENEQGKIALQKEFEEKELQRELAHLDNVIAQMKAALANEEFEGVKLHLLSDEEKQALLDNLDQVILKKSELLAGGKPKTDDLEGESSPFASGLDILGFSPDQWIATFDNLDTTAQKIEAAKMAVDVLMQGWAAFSNFQAAREQADMQRFESAQQKKQNRLKNQLDQGFINQRQYEMAVEAMEKEAAKKKSELEYKAAKREKAMSLASAISGTALAVINALQTKPFLPMGPIMAGVAGAMGALQIATIASTPLPAKGYEKGYGYEKLTREQDGKVFNTRFGGAPTTQLVSEPTRFMAGEGGRFMPELIIDGRTLKQFSPDLKDALYRQLGGIRGFENGYYPNSKNQTSTSPSGGADYAMFAAAMHRNSDLLDEIKAKGIIAYVTNNVENSRKIQEGLDKYQKLREKNTI